jgi:hypothetical protein
LLNGVINFKNHVATVYKVDLRPLLKVFFY